MTSKQEQGKKERRFSQEQYEMLKRCSKKRDMTEWNEWRKKNPGEDVLLEGVNFSKSYLKGVWLNRGLAESSRLEPWPKLEGEVYLEGSNFENANLEDAKLENANLQGASLMGAYLEHAILWDAHLEHAILLDAHLEHASLGKANLESAILGNAHLENAYLGYAHLEHASLMGAHLQHARLNGAHLEHTLLQHAHLEHAWLMEANLEKARFWQVKLQGADFSRAIVDGGTLIDEKCEVDRDTKFEAVAFGNMRIYPKTRQLLECNVRRMNWEEWYREHPVLAWLVKPFWLMSDYGMSTVRVVGVFFLLAFLFAAVYMNWGYWAPPGIVSKLIVQPEIGEAVWHYFGRALIRPVYFSIVTMTTLGFGDMYANKGSIAGHVILAVQVILGYVLLGALITRFAVLFTAGGPAGKFAESGKGPD